MEVLLPAELTVLFHSSENTARLVHRTGFPYKKQLLPVTNPKAKKVKAAQGEHLHQFSSLGLFGHICVLIDLLGYDTDIINQGWPSSTYRRVT